MEPDGLGPQGFNDEDRSYRGARFSEVRDAIFADPYRKVWGGKNEPPLAVYEVTLSSVLVGVLPFGKPHQFLAAARRTVDSHADLRWGPDRKGYRRLLHPNGICLTGRWEITTDEGATRGTALFQRRSFKNWRRIGKMIFDNAVAWYNGDFVIHFHHPAWRQKLNARNDPSTATRR